jgi:hypothetical protein
MPSTRPQRKVSRERPPSSRRTSRQPLVDEVAVFTADTDAFSLANTNATVADFVITCLYGPRRITGVCGT